MTRQFFTRLIPPHTTSTERCDKKKKAESRGTANTELNRPGTPIQFELRHGHRFSAGSRIEQPSSAVYGDILTLTIRHGCDIASAQQASRSRRNNDRKRVRRNVGRPKGRSWEMVCSYSSPSSSAIPTSLVSIRTRLWNEGHAPMQLFWVHWLGRQQRIIQRLSGIAGTSRCGVALVTPPR